MFASHNLFSGKRNYLLALAVVLCTLVLYVAYGNEDQNDFDAAKREVLLRRMGHELLLQSGDSTSRVLPVKKIASAEYQIRFEKEFAFQTDSLVRITQRVLAKDLFARDYVVTVLNCSNSSVAYGYAMSKDKKDTIVACIGRKQPKACYTINIKFKPTGINATTSTYLFGGISLLALVGFVVLKSVTPRKSKAIEEYNQAITFGLVLFDVPKRQLLINNTTIDLTGTETRLLLIFALAPNEIIERSRLQKEIWEDEGVIVGRSLDMFISKLRKKLELDPNSSIVVVRGKGYKLHVTV